ncbi:hypothetical protein G6F59_018462 [Rhizopus arrhizus]|nr:hypothetical protein G6F59_018462 [Rhizopus arrhizus]
MRDQVRSTRTNSAAEPSVTTTTASIIGHSRRTMRPSDGPDASCHALVTKVGMNSIDAAATGDSAPPSRPMATVGRPIPVTPLTMPASPNTTSSST